ncbi:MAG: hypothetical protein GC180_06780 [Bacteroidetes bacterium]|nr:hypothetical protein [Bacteroidota bacterium]
MKTESLLRFAPWVVALIYFILSAQLPFWGDSIASVSKAAVRIYTEGLANPWNYPDADPGHPTLFPWMIALFWKALGFQLWVPHLMVAILSALLLKELILASRLLDEKLQLWALILGSIAPLMLSQAIEISLALPLTLLFFIAARNLKKCNTRAWVLAATAMVLVHLQGLMLLGALGFYDLLRSWPLRKSFFYRLPYYFIPLLAFGIWLYFHQRAFGWALFTPNYERGAPGLHVAIYNLFISGWRIIDLGYFVMILPVMYRIIHHLIKKKGSDQEKLFLSLFLVLAIGIPVVFAYPPNHRYLLPIYILSIPLFLRILLPFSNKKKALILSASFLVLLSGNLWFYPGKCLGDQNLVFLNYRPLEKQMIQDLPDSATVYSYAPLNNASLYTYLKDKRSIRYDDLYGKDYASCDWIAESNLNCEFNQNDRDSLEALFVSHTYENYGVFVRLWMNKKLLPTYPDFPGPDRQPGSLEKLIRILKAKFRS